MFFKINKTSYLNGFGWLIHSFIIKFDGFDADRCVFGVLRAILSKKKLLECLQQCNVIKLDYIQMWCINTESFVESNFTRSICRIHQLPFECSKFLREGIGARWKEITISLCPSFNENSIGFKLVESGRWVTKQLREREIKLITSKELWQPVSYKTQLNFSPAVWTVSTELETRKRPVLWNSCRGIQVDYKEWAGTAFLPRTWPCCAVQILIEC